MAITSRNGFDHWNTRNTSEDLLRRVGKLPLKNKTVADPLAGLFKDAAASAGLTLTHAQATDLIKALQARGVTVTPK
jgi:hypothetical protein